MTEEVKSTTTAAKGIPSVLESVVEVKFLLLLICFVFYLDAWLIHYQIDPTNETLKSIYKGLLEVPLFTLILFVGSYSLLMVGVSPVLRFLVATARIYFQSSVKISNYTKEEKQQADWAMSVVVLTIYSWLAGSFVEANEYHGLTLYIISILDAQSLTAILFRFAAMLFWLYCLLLAISSDDVSL